MSKCKYLIDISPHDPLCDHPCRLYGGGAVDAECETCQYRIEDLERENVKLRELVRDMMVAWWACDNDRCPRHDKRCKEGKFCAFDECARELGVEIKE